MSPTLCFLGLKAPLPVHSATMQPIKKWNWGTVHGEWQGSVSCSLPAEQQPHLSPSKSHNSTLFMEPSQHPEIQGVLVLRAGQLFGKGELLSV